MASRIFAALFAFAYAAFAWTRPLELPASPSDIVEALRGHRVVLFGEVHDNPIQHALRLGTLRALFAKGARPAIAFEQFDRERQRDIDRARRERPRDADYLIAEAKGNPGWRWELYRPYLQLALDYDVPIVAANLSRSDAMRVALQGWRALFDAQTARELKLDALPAEFWRKHEHEIELGHCNLLDAKELPPLARAQVARDIVMSQAIGPHLQRGVVLLAGNGHVRRDIGVPFWLAQDARRGAFSIGLLERDDNATARGADFDAYVVTARAERPDPCAELTKRRDAGPSR